MATFMVYLSAMKNITISVNYFTQYQLIIPMDISIIISIDDPVHTFNEVNSNIYREDPFRAVNFKRDDDGNLICPNNKKFIYLKNIPVKGNRYERTEEIYVCENCEGCPYGSKCTKSKHNRTIRLNQEMTSFHEEVLENLESVQGALLRMNRSIQSEGTYGVIK